MTDVAVVREIAWPAAPYSRDFETPRGWPEWIAQGVAQRPAATPAPVAAAAGDDAAAFAAAAATLHAARLEEREADTSGDAWTAVVARHQVYLARRALRVLNDAAAAPEPGTRLEWCCCDAEPIAR